MTTKSQRSFAGRRRTGGFSAIALTFVFVLGGFALGSALTNVAGLTAGLDPGASAAGSALRENGVLILTYGGVAVLLFAWVLAYERSSPRRLGFTGPRGTRRFLLGAALGLALLTAVVLVGLATGEGFHQPSVPGLVGLTALPGIVLIAVGWAFQAGVEEALFRGWLLPRLTARTGAVVAVVVESLLFALAHALQGRNVLALVTLFLWGVFLSIVTLRQGSVWLAWGWHATFNWATGAVFGLAGADALAPGGTLWNLGDRAPHYPLSNDGTIGEAALMTALVAAALLLTRGTLGTLRTRREGHTPGSPQDGRS